MFFSSFTDLVDKSWTSRVRQNVPMSVKRIVTLCLSIQNTPVAIRFADL